MPPHLTGIAAMVIPALPRRMPVAGEHVARRCAPRALGEKKVLTGVMQEEDGGPEGG
jgi:hypothetical protein